MYTNHVIIKLRGRPWFRRGLQNLRCMQSLSKLLNQTQLNINANDAYFAEEAIAA